jgi:hypothetical protein
VKLFIFESGSLLGHFAKQGKQIDYHAFKKAHPKDICVYVYRSRKEKQQMEMHDTGWFVMPRRRFLDDYQFRNFTNLFLAAGVDVIFTGQTSGHWDAWFAMIPEHIPIVSMVETTTENPRVITSKGVESFLIPYQEQLSDLGHRDDDAEGVGAVAEYVD